MRMFSLLLISLDWEGKLASEKFSVMKFKIHLVFPIKSRMANSFTARSTVKFTILLHSCPIAKQSPPKACSNSSRMACLVISFFNVSCGMK